MPCWRLAPAVVKEYKGAHWIHPLKQHHVEVLLEEIKKYPGIEYAIIFGSSVEERCTDFSDIDVLMKGARDARFVAPDNDVYDIIYAESLSPTDELWDEIRRDGICIYDKEVDGPGLG